jgi:hypothetical protein
LGRRGWRWGTLWLELMNYLMDGVEEDGDVM